MSSNKKTTINKETLEYLAGLARIDIGGIDKEKMIKDIGEIFNYFEELKEVDTSDVLAMTGGTQIQNAFREDKERQSEDQKLEVKNNCREAFPDKKDGFLKIPPVFE